MRIGFIGTGGITSAIVAGLCTSRLEFDVIRVSPRNRETSLALKKRFDRVRIGESNQDVLDHSDVVILAILPQDMKKILADLDFKSGQVVIHLLAGVKISEISPLIEPGITVIRAVPLPCVAIHKGPIALFPENETAVSLFEVLGSVIVVDSELQLESLSIVTALMAPYYALLNTVSDWAVNQGIGRKNATDYTTAMFGALSLIAEQPVDGDIRSLIKESMTPGGLNELAMSTIDERGGFDNVVHALDRVKIKVTG